MSSKRKNRDENTPPSGSPCAQRPLQERMDANMMAFAKAAPKEREEMLQKAKPLVDLDDPFVHIEWHHANIAHAAMGGPHLDALGNPDPRNAQHIEQFLVNTHQAQVFVPPLLSSQPYSFHPFFL